MIFVDDLHLDFRNTGRIRNMMKVVVTELFQEQDRFAIASSGPSTIAVDVTSDRQLLDASIRKISGNALRYEDIQASQSFDEVRYRASVAAATAQSFLSNASRLPAGPKAMLFISNGYSFTPPDIVETLAALTTTATQSGVRVFTIDPRASFTDQLPVLLDAGWPAHLAAQQVSLRSLADKTNGLAIVDGPFADQLRRIADVMRR
jgi:hypothetical protein